LRKAPIIELLRKSSMSWIVGYAYCDRTPAGALRAISRLMVEGEHLSIRAMARMLKPWS